MTDNAFTPIMSDEKLIERLVGLGHKNFKVLNGNVYSKSKANLYRMNRALIGFGGFACVSTKQQYDSIPAKAN